MGIQQYYFYKTFGKNNKYSRQNSLNTTLLPKGTDNDNNVMYMICQVM